MCQCQCSHHHLLGASTHCSTAAQKNGFLAICGSDLGAELATSSLRKKSQYIFLFSMHQFSSSNFRCKLKSTKPVGDEKNEVGENTFSGHYSLKLQTFCSWQCLALVEWKWKARNLRPHLSLSISCRTAIPRDGLLCPKCFILSKFS